MNVSSPQVVSHNSSGYSGNEQFSGQNQQQQQWQQSDHEQMMWDRQSQHQHHENKIGQHNYQQVEQNSHQYINQQQSNEHSENSPTKMRGNSPQKTFSQADKVNLNTRIKTMILNKQQNDAKMEQEMKNVDQNQTTGHFLWYSHHHHLDPLSADGGPPKKSPNCDRKYHNDRISNNTQKFAQSNIKLTGFINKYNELPFDSSSVKNAAINYEMPKNSNMVNTSKYSKQYITKQSNPILKTDPYKSLHKFEQKEPVEDIIHQRESIIHLVHGQETGFNKPMMENIKTDLNPSCVTTNNQLDYKASIQSLENLPQHFQLENKPIKTDPETASLNRDACRTPQSPRITSVSSPHIHTAQNNFTGRQTPQSPSVNNPHSPMYPTSTSSPMGLSIEQKSGMQCSAPQSPHDTSYYYQNNQIHGFNNPDNLAVNQNMQNSGYKNLIQMRDPHLPVLDPHRKPRQSNLFVSPERTKQWLHDKKKELTQSPQKSSKEKMYSPDSSKPDKTPPKVIGEEIPQCHCFPSDQNPPEPGTYYTHLGCANSLRTLRHNLECQTGTSGSAIRIEKVRYTGKEGKTAQGCPIVKWVSF